MANISRKVGVNILEFMRKTNISLDSFAEQLGYSINDVKRMVEGRVFLPPRELERIAVVLETTKNELLSYNAEYLVPELQYMKEFKDPDNLDIILDLMDEYVECLECM